MSEEQIGKLEAARAAARADAAPARVIPDEALHYIVLARYENTRQWCAVDIKLSEEEAIATCVAQRLNSVYDAVRYVPTLLPLGESEFRASA